MSGPDRRPFRLFQSVLPLDAKRSVRDALAGFQLAAMNIPQALGYTKIAGMPVVTGFYTLLLPLVAFAPYFRALVAPELQRSVNFKPEQWARAQQALTALPVGFLSTQFTGNTLADLQRVFMADASATPPMQVSAITHSTGCPFG